MRIELRICKIKGMTTVLETPTAEVLFAAFKRLPATEAERFWQLLALDEIEEPLQTDSVESDETEYLLQSSAMKERLLGALKRSRAREVEAASEVSLEVA